MKINILSNTFFNIYNFRIDLIKFLIHELNADVNLIANFDGYEKLIKIRKTKKKNINFYSRSLNPFYNLKSLFNIYNFFKAKKNETILSYTFKCNFLINFLNFRHNYKIISNITGMGDMYLSKNIFKIFIFKIYCKLLNNSQIIVCQNKDDKKILCNKNINLKKKIIVINGSGINTNKYKLKSIDHNNKNFLMVARIIKEKGILEFLGAVKNFKKNNSNHKVSFTLIGDNYNDNFFKKIETLLINKNIKYIKNSNNIKNYIQNSFCCVLPSYREGLSKFLLESIASGRPIITSNVPGCKELVINNKSGFLLKSINSIELSNCFSKVINLSKNEFSNFSKKSREISKKYESSIINSKYLYIIKKLI
tara:strand:- start:223 stop:1317 length:1095 start_codon:yes stop_codon:yes gene_type:complete